MIDLAASQRCLWIARAFPPISGAEPIVSAYACTGVLAHGWRPIVLSVEPRTSGLRIDPSLNSLVADGVPCFRTWQPSRRLFGLLRRLGLGALGQLPDRDILWSLTALPMALYLAHRYHVSVVHTRSVPFTSHLVGLWLKSRIGAPWVAYFSDPWVDSPYGSLSPWIRKINAYLEKRVVAAADALIFVTEEARELMLGKYEPEHFIKSWVIPHGIDFDSDGKISPCLPLSSKLRLVYTGSFYGPRTPEPLWTALELMCAGEQNPRLEVLLVGPHTDDDLASVPESFRETLVRWVGPVSYGDSLAYMASADVLLLIDAPTPGPNPFLPSKLVDYLRFGKPILAVTPLVGTSADLVRAVNGIVVAPRDTIGLTTALDEILSKYAHGELRGFDIHSPVINKYRINHTAKQLALVFSSVLK